MVSAPEGWDGRIKTCGHCHRPLRVTVGVTYTRNRFMHDGLQINCRECDERRKATDPEYGFGALKRTIGDEGDQVKSAWTFHAYAEIVGGKDGKLGLCLYCGARLSEWGKGHHLDRIDSHRPHVPDNVVPCCSACNWSKGHDNVESWRARTLTPLLHDYGRGKIPWAKIFDGKGPKRVVIPDLGAFVANIQMDLLLDGIR